MIGGLGKRLRQLRKARNLTQKQVAERVGVTRTVLSQYENDHTAPSLEVLVKLANQFGVSTDYRWTIFRHPSRARRRPNAASFCGRWKASGSLPISLNGWL